MAKLTAKQVKEVEKRVTAHKEAGTTFPALAAIVDAAYTNDDASEIAVCHEVERRLIAWSDSNRRAYTRFAADVKAVEKANGNTYLFDECVTTENLPEGMTEQSIGYWPAMLRTAFSDCGSRANEAGIDLNKALGYTVY